MFKLKSFFLILTTLIFTSGCDGLKRTVKNVFEVSERAAYERRFSGADSLLVNWKNEFASAEANQLKIPAGYSAVTPSGIKSAMGYSVDLKRGDLLLVEATANPALKIFIDIFEVNADSESDSGGILENGIFKKFIEKTGVYKIVIQPEINYPDSFAFKIYTQPSLKFPVAGKGNRDVQSFWGAIRDGGDRNHEGVDIFAARGTPVVAATDGFVTRTGNSGLGGKQVWLRDGNLGNSLYYAHLDSIMVEAGKQVKAGDTLGTVGSTGNAAGGATHLHFGIYSTGGAVDPYPYIHQRSIPEQKKTNVNSAAALKKSSKLRSGPGAQFDTVATLSEKTDVDIISGNGEWYHVKTADSIEGFVIKSRLE
ncbi:M23 family metallopeptidase [Chryseobacterium sp.]|uniref:M23 family metallopeptidase n=1 Tax=Chryseobacterium sp. TaxID=1871047 RepID=UPI00162379E2|nr:M23 family metallopeptidase [Chryseobacterium sp.]